jgi:hypothetical protein
MLLCVPAKAGDENGMTTWLMGDYNQTGVRVGYAWETFEIFGQSYWWLWEHEDPPQTYGLGVIYDFPGEIDISQIPVLNILEGQISLASYVGFQGAIELNGDHEERGYLGPLFGLVMNRFIFDEVDDEITTGSELQYVNYIDQWEDDIRGHELRAAFFVRIEF